MIISGRGGIYIDLQVQPKSRDPGVSGTVGERLKISVAAPAEGGKANEATVIAVAELLGVPRGSVSLVSGKTTRRKRVHIRGIDSATARRLIESALDE